MADEIAGVGIRVDTDGVSKGITALDALASQGPKVEKSLQGVETSAAKTGKSLATLGQGGSDSGLAKFAKIGAEAATTMGQLGDASAKTAIAAKKAGDDASAGLDKIGISAKQTAAAMRQVPAQFTDIVTALQGGQNPLTVLLQQGGQLKDAFGGAGAATRALGGYVIGLVNPFTLAAGAATALGIAYLKGAAEAEAFQKTLILTGNAAGVTAERLSSIAAGLRTFGLTQGAASDALNQLAATGKVGEDNLGRFAAAAVRLERVGGPAVEETVKAFAELGKAPLQASLKLNDATNFLTASVYDQIRALDQQGKTAEAARVAQEAFASTAEQRIPQLAENLGLLERGWNAVKDAIKGAADAALDVGRTTPDAQRIEQLRTKIAAASQANQIFGRAGFNFGGADAADLEELDRLEKKVAKSRELAKLDADRLKTVQARNEFDRIAEGNLDKQAKLALEIQRIEAIGLAAGKERAEIDKQIAAAREKAADKSAGKEAERELEARARLMAELAGLTGDFAKEWDRLNALFRSGDIKTVEQLEQAQARLLEKQPAIRENMKAELDAAKAIADARISARRAEDKAIADFIEKQREQEAAALKSIRDRTTQLEVENEASEIAQKENISLAEAINKVSIARLQDKAAGLQDGSEAKNAILQQIEAYKLLGQQISTKELNTFLDPSKAKTFGEALTGAFEAAGNGLAKLSSALQTYTENQRQNAAAAEAMRKQAPGADRDRAAAVIAERSQRNQLSLYASMTSAAKGFFNEGTRGYKALEAAENAFRAYQLASDLQKGLSAAAVAVANQAQGDPYSAWARMAAMAAAMAGLGFAVTGGFGGGPTSGGDGGQQATGTGTVLGDAAAKSESIAKSIDRLADTAKLQLTTQSGMLSALRNIENSIGGLSGLIVRSNSGDLTTGNSFGVSTGSKVSLLNRADLNLTALGATLGGPIGAAIGLAVSKIPVIDSIAKALFGTKTSITGTGLNLPQQTLAQAMVNSQLQQYVDTYSKKKFFGITYSTSTGSQYQAADAQLAQQFTTIFKSFYEGVTAAAGPLGQSLEEVQARLNGFVLNIGKIDLKDLTGEQIQEKLTAVLGAAADNIATAAIPGLQEFQKVGEGYFETLIRVASGVESATASLDYLGIAAIGFGDIGRKQGDVAAEIVRQSIAQFEALDGTLSSVGSLINSLDGSADDLVSAYKSLVDVRDILISVGKSGDSLTASMIRGAGGLDQLQSSLSSYFENFFSDAERTAAGKAQLQAQFDRLGLGALPETREAFRDLAQGIDTSTDAGQKLYAQVIGLAGAFADLVPAVESVADTTAETMRRLAQSYADSRSQLEIELMRANGDEAGARARERAVQLARDTAGLSADDAAAVAALYDYNRALRDQIDAARAAVEAQKAIEAAQKSAAESLQRVFDDLGSTRFDLENQLLTTQGSVDEVARRTRERDLAKLTSGLSAADAARVAAAYDYNAALQAQIKASEDAQKQAEDYAAAQSQAAEEAMRAAQQIADAWKSASDSIMDEVARIRGLVSNDSSASFAQSQSAFAIALAQSQAGDLNAYKLLPSLSQAMLSIGEQQAVSLSELQSLRARTAGSLEAAANAISATYGVATAKSITGVTPTSTATAPTTYTVAPIQASSYASTTQSMQSDLLAEMQAMRAEMTEMRKQLDVSNSNTGRSAQALEGNQTVPILVEIAA